jgi:lysine 6-dehydrogenase
MAKVVVLGAGMVGSVMAAEMSRDGEHDLIIADRSDDSLAHCVTRASRMGGRVETRRVDLSEPATVTKLAREAEVVIGAMPSQLGLQTLRAVIEAECNYCDISFMPQDPRELDARAKERGVTAIVDCGVAPGMSNLIAGHAARQFDRCERIAIYVGGVPRERRWPFEYKAAFSPADVIEEYTRPARIVEHGRIVIKEALSDAELIDFPGVGTLEAFNTDGLRSLADTLDVPHMVEKTLRYPGHAELMRAFRATGLFSTEPIEVNGATVKPRDVLAKLMFPMWGYAEGERDLTVLRVTAEGEKSGRTIRLIWDLLDELDPQTGFTSMARTTAFPCTIAAKWLLEGRKIPPGIIVPEQLAENPNALPDMLQALENRGVSYRHRASEPVDS